MQQLKIGLTRASDLNFTHEVDMKTLLTILAELLSALALRAILITFIVALGALGWIDTETIEKIIPTILS